MLLFLAIVLTSGAAVAPCDFDHHFEPCCESGAVSGAPESHSNDVNDADHSTESDSSDRESHRCCPLSHAPLLAVVSLPDIGLSCRVTTGFLALEGDLAPDSLTGEIDYPPQLG